LKRSFRKRKGVFVKEASKKKRSFFKKNFRKRKGAFLREASEKEKENF